VHVIARIDQGLLDSQADHPVVFYEKHLQFEFGPGNELRSRIPIFSMPTA
jgi:hypothetical protein